MPRLDESFDDLARALHAHYGVGPSPTFTSDPAAPWFERVAEVALGLNAAPKVVAAALTALRDAGLLDPVALAAANPLAIDDTLKGARVAIALKSLRPLQKIARWAADQSVPLDGPAIASFETESLRDDWRAINGVGPALADALLLLALGRSTFPVDRAAFRVLVRHNWLEVEADYDEARSVIERHAERSDLASRGELAAAEADPTSTEARLLADLREWLARVGRDFCKPSQPKCERCPLQPWLPPEGPVAVE